MLLEGAPAFADPQEIIAASAVELRVPERISVSEAAVRYMRLYNPKGYSGPFPLETAPFLQRPMDCLGPEYPYTIVPVMGPAQTYKSTIGNAQLVHGVMVDPGDIMMVCPDRNTVTQYVQTQLDRIIEHSPALRARLLRGEQSNNTHLKQFIGLDFFAAWPVGSSFRARPVPRMRYDDYDAIPQDIEGEGNPITLGTGRQTTFEGFAKHYANSSPVLGELFGIEALVAAGTDERWTVDCLQCHEPFVMALFDVLVFDDSAGPEEARKSASVVCPDCGNPHEYRHKEELMGTGRWVGHGETAVPGGKEGELIVTDTASFRFDGLMGAMSWGKLAHELRKAQIKNETVHDDTDLRAFHNTRAGVNYTPQREGEEPVTVDVLQVRRDESDYVLGEVPDWVTCLTAAVDVQKNRFEVMVMGWGEGLRSAVVDRFPIVALEGGTKKLSPARYAAHWNVLIDKVMKRRYPVQGQPATTLRILNTAIDTGGMDGVTDNAFAFFFHATSRKVGYASEAITLIKGGNKPKSKLLPAPSPDAKRQLKGAAQAELYVPNVSRLKDIGENRLGVLERGPGFIDLPSDFDDEWIDEIRAEVKQGDEWVQLSYRANETWDLLGYCYVAILRFGGQSASLSWVAERAPWALPKKTAPLPSVERAVPEDAGEERTAKRVKISRKSAPGTRRRGRGIRVRKG